MKFTPLFLLQMIILTTISCGNGSSQRVVENELEVQEEPENPYIGILLGQELIEIDIDNAEIGPRIDFKSVVKSVEVIDMSYGLELASWLTVADSRNIICVHTFEHKIFQFDIQGNFLRNIGKKGTNTSIGEFRGVKDVAIDSKRNVIYVLDHYSSVVLKYKIDGTFVGSISVETGKFENDIFMVGSSLCDGIRTDSDGNLLVHYASWDGNRPEYNYYLYDSDGNFINGRKSFRIFSGSTGRKTGVIDELSSYYYNGILHVKDAGDTLYTVANGNFIPKYLFKSKCSISKIVNSENFFKKTIHLGHIFENDRYLFFSYKEFPILYEPSTYWVGYFDKQNKRTYQISPKDDDPSKRLSYISNADYIYADYFDNPINGGVVYKIDSRANTFRKYTLY